LVIFLLPPLAGFARVIGNWSLVIGVHPLQSPQQPRSFSLRIVRKSDRPVKNSAATTISKQTSPSQPIEESSLSQLTNDQ
jgi:hypothetical protein